MSKKETTLEDGKNSKKKSMCVSHKNKNHARRMSYIPRRVSLLRFRWICPFRGEAGTKFHGNTFWRHFRCSDAGVTLLANLAAFPVPVSSWFAFTTSHHLTLWPITRKLLSVFRVVTFHLTPRPHETAVEINSSFGKSWSQVPPALI